MSSLCEVGDFSCKKLLTALVFGDVNDIENSLSRRSPTRARSIDTFSFLTGTRPLEQYYRLPRRNFIVMRKKLKHTKYINTYKDSVIAPSSTKHELFGEFFLVYLAWRIASESTVLFFLRGYSGLVINNSHRTSQLG